jgi:hypothetical protein
MDTETETDANSPISEELMSQIRENLESNTMNRIYSGFRAKVVSRDAYNQLTVTKVDSGDVDWPANITATLIMTFSVGALVGQNFVIASNTALTTGNATVTINTTSPNPSFPAGYPVANDVFLVMYAQTGQAHTHNGIDSAPIGSTQLIYRNSTDRFPPVADSYTSGVEYVYFSPAYNSYPSQQVNIAMRSIFKGLQVSCTMRVDSSTNFSVLPTVVFANYISAQATTNVDGTGSSHVTNVYAPVSSSVTVLNTTFDGLNTANDSSRAVRLDLPYIDISSLGLVDGDTIRLTLSATPWGGSITSATDLNVSEITVFGLTRLM